MAMRMAALAMVVTREAGVWPVVAELGVEVPAVVREAELSATAAASEAKLTTAGSASGSADRGAACAVA